MKPTTTALHRRQPTASRRIGTDNAVIRSGVAKMIAYASASGSRLKA
jgi:hypothetical protein